MRIAGAIGVDLGRLPNIKHQLDDFHRLATFGADAERGDVQFDIVVSGLLTDVTGRDTGPPADEFHAEQVAVEVDRPFDVGDSESEMVEVSESPVAFGCGHVESSRLRVTVVSRPLQ